MQLATKVVTGLLLTAAAIAAPAHSFALDEAHVRLADTINQVGVKTLKDGEACDKYNAAGMFNGRRIMLCTVHNRDHADYQNTLRHEAIHLMQLCNGMNNPDAQLSDGLLPISTTAVRVGWERYPRILMSYPAIDQTIEAEAWAAADILTADQVATGLKKHCSFAFN